MLLIMLKMIGFFALAAGICYCLTACKKDPDIRKDYDFALHSWYLQKEIREAEPVEIRLYLNRYGDYRDAAYFIGYIQLEGTGELYDSDDHRYITREIYPLSEVPGLDSSDPNR